VIDKSQSNFCDYFNFGSVPQANRKEVSEKNENAKMKLESLFKKD